MQKNLLSKNALKLFPGNICRVASLLQRWGHPNAAKQKLLFLLLTFLPLFSLQAQTTYTWNTGVANGAFGTASNWTPSRLSPASTDILLFTSSATVTGVTGGTIRQLHVSNNATVSLQSSTSGTISITGDASATGLVDFSIAPGSTLNLANPSAGTPTLGISFASGNSPTGTIDGTLILTGNGTIIKNSFSATNAVVTVNGTIENAGTVTAAAANLKFNNGGVYNHKFTTISGTIPSATWNAGSKALISGYTTYTSGVTNIGQTFADFTWDCTGQGSAYPSVNVGTMTVTGTFTLEKGNLKINNGTATNLVVKDFTMNAGTLEFYSGTNTTVATNLKVSGTFAQAGGTITESGSSNTNTIELNGTSNQIVSFGTITNAINYKISNNAGISLQGGMLVNDGATLTIASTATNPVSGGSISYGAGTTLAYAAAGPLTATSDIFPSSGGPASLTTNVTGTFPDNKLILPFNSTLTGILTMTAGNIDLNGNSLMLGTSAAAPGALVYTSGYLLNGSFLRYLGTGTIASGNAAGRFPLGYVSATGTFYDRTLFLDHSGTLASGGLVGVTYNEVAGTTGISPDIPDGGVNIDLRLNSNWEVYQAGLSLGGDIMNMSVTGNGFPIDDYSQLRLMQANGILGTAGTNSGSNAAPKVVRAFTSEADLYNTFYIGSDDVSNSFADIITAVTSGSWGDPNTWDTRTVPTLYNNVIIPAGIIVTLDEGTFSYECSNLTLNGTTSGLVANDYTLTIGRPGGNNKTFTVNGVLTLGGATINLNGNLLLNAGATFNMSGGSLVIDGNDGNVQSSVASGITLFDIAGTINSSVTGGMITFVDPPFAGTGLTFRYNGGTAISWPDNIMQFGGSTYTNASSATNGFEVNTFNNGFRLTLGDVIVNGNGGTGLAATRLTCAPSIASKGFNIGGNLTINANSELRTFSTTSMLTLGGNLTNNGAMVNLATLELSKNNAATPTAQTISGSGTFRNANDPTAADASFNALTVNNSNPTSGVTIDVPGLVIKNTLALTSGLIRLGTNDLTLSTTSTISGTFSATNMVVINGTGQLKKKYNTGNTNFTFPIGEMNGTTEYTPAIINMASNTVIRTIGARVTNAAHPDVNSNNTQTDYIDRYWTFSDDQAGNGTYSFTGSFKYAAADIHGTEANMKLNRYKNNAWSTVVSGAASNTLTFSTAITDLGGSDFTGRVNGATTYTWDGSASADFTDPLNWTPDRNSPATDDILIFNNTLTNTITNVPSQSIGQLLLANGTSVSLNPSTAAATLNIAGGAGTDLDIPTGSTLSLAGTSPNVMSLAFTGSVTVDVAGTLLNNVSNNIDFINGITRFKTGGIFHNKGNTNNGSTSNLFFEAGSTYRHDKNGGGLATGTYDNASTAEVLGVTSTAITVPTSLGNLTWNSPLQTVAAVNLNTLVNINGNLKIDDTGTGSIVTATNLVVKGNFTQSNGTVIICNSTSTINPIIEGNLNLSGTGTLIVNNTSGTTNLTVKGDLNQTGGTINLNNYTSTSGSGTLTLKQALNQTGGVITRNAAGTAGATIVFSGTAAQNVTFFTNGVTNKVNYTLNNASGIVLTGTLPVNNGATLTNTSTGSTFSGSGTVAYTGTTTLAYNGATAQTATIAEFPASDGPTNVNISNTVTLTGGHRNIAGTLNLTAATGILKLGACNLTFGVNAPTPTGYNGTTSYILQDGTGRLFKTIAAGTTTQFAWPVAVMNGGTPEYSAASFAFSANTVERTIGVEVVSGTHPNMNSNGTPTAYIKRYWTFTDSEAGNGTYSYNMAFRSIAASDVVGDVNTLKINRWDGSAWKQVTGTVDLSNPTYPLLKITPDQTSVSCPLGGNTFTGRVNPTSEFVWNGSTSTDWFDPLNWTPNGTPTGSDSVVINNAAATFQPVLSSSGGPVSLKSLTLTNGNLSLGTNASLMVENIFTFAAPASTNFDCNSTFTYAGNNAQTIYALDYGNLISSGTGARTLDNGNINICGSFTSGTNLYTVGSSSVNFTGTGATTIPAITYNDLSISGSRGANNITLANGTLTIGGVFTSNATFSTGTFVPGTSTVVLNNTSPRIIPAINYNNLTASGGDRTITGTVKIAGTFTPGTGNYTVVAGSTVEFNGTGTQTIPVLAVASGGSYYNLNVSAAGIYSFGGTMTVDGDYTQSAGTVNVSNGAVNHTVNILGNMNVSGGTFRLIPNLSATGATVRVGTAALPKNLNISGSGSIGLESTSSGTGVALLVVTGNVTSNTSATNAVDFGTGTVTNNEMQVGGDLTITGTGKFVMSGTGSHPKGLVFTKTGTQKISSAVAFNKVPFIVNSGSTLELLTDLTFTGIFISGRTIIRIDGTLDMAGRTVTGDSNNNLQAGTGGTVKTNGTGTAPAIINFGWHTINGTYDLGEKQISPVAGATFDIFGTIKTARAEGFTGSANTAIKQTTQTINMKPDCTIEYNGTAAQIISARTDYQNLTISGGSTKTLAGNTTVAKTLTMTSGILQTSTNTLTLAETALVANESSTSYINGTVATTATMSAAGNYTFNGVGLTLSPQAASTNFPGATTVRRITGTPITSGGNQSIARSYEIVPTTNQDLNITMAFSYLDPELNGIAEQNLVFFKSANGGEPWIIKGKTSSDAAANTVTLTGITDFSTWTLGDIGAPLPVELVAFGARKAGSDVEVSWTTTTEKDSKGYEVQVSANGSEFRTLGFVESRNSNSLQEYTFTDAENGKTGIRYYRLKQTDLDGTVTYYGPKTVRFEAEKLQLTAYPNPFEREVNLKISAAETGKATLKLTGLSGKTVFAQEVNVLKGNNTLTIGLEANLPAGVYLLQAQFGAEQITSRLLKQ